MNSAINFLPATAIMVLMRGRPSKQTSFSAMISFEQAVEASLHEKHPLRLIRKHTDNILHELSPEFDRLYAKTGRRSIPPELLLRALLWQMLFSVRSERLLMEVLQFDMRCRWFVGLPPDQDAWDHSTFTANRKSMRLDLMAEAFFKKQVEYLRRNDLVSNEHFTVDGTLLQAWASHKSMVEKSKLDEDGNPPPPPGGGRNAPSDFKGEKRNNETHVSATDRDARIARKNGTSTIAHMLSVMMENRNGFAVSAMITKAMSTAAERRTALVQVQQMKREGWDIKTLGADKGYSENDFVEALLELNVEPHLAARPDRPKALANQLHVFPDYKISQRIRMFVETIFGYMKTVADIRQVKLRGHIRVQGLAYMALFACNIQRLSRILP